MSERDNLNSILYSIRKLEEEKPYQYETFLVYASLHFAERTLQNTANKTGYALDTLKDWSVDFDWQKRVSQVDTQAYIDEYLKKKELNEEDVKRYVDYNRQFKNRILEVNEKILTLSEKLISQALRSDEVIEGDFVETKDGRTVATSTIINVKSKVSDIPRLMDVALKNQMRVNDLPTEVIGEEVVSANNLKDLSLEELAALRGKTRAKIHEITGTQKLNTTA